MQGSQTLLHCLYCSNRAYYSASVLIGACGAPAHLLAPGSGSWVQNAWFTDPFALPTLQQPRIVLCLGAGRCGCAQAGKCPCFLVCKPSL